MASDVASHSISHSVSLPSTLRHRRKTYVAVNLDISKHTFESSARDESESKPKERAKLNQINIPLRESYQLCSALLFSLAILRRAIHIIILSLYTRVCEQFTEWFRLELHTIIQSTSIVFKLHFHLRSDACVRSPLINTWMNAGHWRCIKLRILRVKILSNKFSARVSSVFLILCQNSSIHRK